MRRRVVSTDPRSGTANANLGNWPLRAYITSMHATADIVPPVSLHPLIRRIVAGNPSPFTLDGTQTYLVGRGVVAVIDPGPNLAAHVRSILLATRGERISHIVCTHTHTDHSPAAKALRKATSATIVGCGPLTSSACLTPQEASHFDLLYAPDRALRDGERIEGPDWTLEAIETPGHTSNHICLALLQANALFTGDHVMGWSTTVVSPPDGNMAQYMASLNKLMSRSDSIYYPAHGEAVTNPRELVERYIKHRRVRESQIVKALAAGPMEIHHVVTSIYEGLDKSLYAAASQAILAHLLDLKERGLSACGGVLWSLTGLEARSQVLSEFF
jgi:glyoxylase-like metal-dependent hydrolase (beta-lactamase superfamily II)